MTLAVARIGDTFTDTDTIAQGSGDVFVNNIPIARLTDITTGHTLPFHPLFVPIPINSGSGSVFANNLPIARLTDTHAMHVDPPHPPTHPHDGIINSASGDVFSG